MDPVMDKTGIRKSTIAIMNTLPEGVTLVAAGKTRSPEQLEAVIEAGVTIIGHNYVQEAERSIEKIGPGKVKWHMIGHLQRNKAKKAVQLFDLVETVDKLRLGEALDRASAQAGRVMPVLVEVNSAEEESKSGVPPGAAEELVRGLSRFDHIRVEGIMTMGRFSPDPEDCRPCFRLAKDLFDRLASLDLPGVTMRHLSMGMSDSYRVAIEEGATLVRIGTALFGPR